MDSAAKNSKRSSRTLDESGHKFGGDASENLSSQGKGSSPTSLQVIRGKGMQVLSVGALRRLETLSEVSKRGQKARNLFRLMGDPTLWMLAYSNIYSNKGAMTPGVDNSTMDGFSEDRALNLIELLKEGVYNHKPVRRTYIPKSNGKVRPLGILTGDDKLVQEVARIILERIFEPIFSDYSHGFRTKRSCHTALLSIQNEWNGVKWIVNVDIKGYFNNIDHEILIKLLEKKIMCLWQRRTK